MKYFFDTEFIEYPNSIHLISIGMVCDDGRVYYAESSEIPWGKASQWVLDHVRPLLGGVEPKPNIIIAAELREFVKHKKPEFWGYFCDYDWVLFCWLQGSMSALPDGWPMFCRDLKQEANRKKVNKLLPKPKRAHNALEDALWTMDSYHFLAKQPEPC